MAFYIAKVAKPEVPAGTGRGGAAAAVGRLPGQGVRVEGDAAAGLRVRGRQRRRLPRLGVRVHARLRLDRRDPRRSPTCGCPSWCCRSTPGWSGCPPSLLDASGDLGARPARTFRSVIVPLLVPSIAAGAVFTFSLSLGDYIIPKVVTEGKIRLIGNLIESTLLAPNQPLAAAFTLVAAAHHRPLPRQDEAPRRLREPVNRMNLSARPAGACGSSPGSASPSSMCRWSSSPS